MSIDYILSPAAAQESNPTATPVQVPTPVVQTVSDTPWNVPIEDSEYYSPRFKDNGEPIPGNTPKSWGIFDIKKSFSAFKPNQKDAEYGEIANILEYLIRTKGRHHITRHSVFVHPTLFSKLDSLLIEKNMQSDFYGGKYNYIKNNVTLRKILRENC